MPRDELAEAVWGETPPPTWEKALTVLVSKLRALLAECGIDGANALTGAFGCYRLDLPEGSWVDVIAAANAAEEAEAALAAEDLAKTRKAAMRAASLSRPFLPGEEGVWVEGKRRELAEVRSRALTCLAEASLRLGDPSGAAKWAAETIALEPFRETGYRLLMNAHATAGNRAEALRVYERCRRLLAEELGAYPSPETQSIYRELLRAPSPEARGAAPEAGPVAAPEREARAGVPPRGIRRRGRALFLVACGAALLLAAVIVVPVIKFLGGGSPGLDSATGNSVALIDADAAAIEARVQLPNRPSAVAAGGGFIWVASEEGGTVARIDPGTLAGQTRVVGRSAAGVAYGGGSVWVTKDEERSVVQIDPDTLTDVQTFPVGNGPGPIAVSSQAVWVANTIDGTVSRIDLARGGAPTTIPVGTAPAGIAVGAGAVWVSSEAEAALYRLDPRSGAIVERIPVGNGSSGVAVGEEGVWVANRQDGTVSRVDPQTNRVIDTVDVGLTPVSVAAASGAVWVANEGEGSIARIDSENGQVDKTLGLASSPNALALSGDQVWAITLPSLSSHRGGVLRVEAVPDCRCLDPAYQGPYEGSWVALAYDGLLAYRHVGGIGGASLVGNLALRVPTPTDQGRTYTFQLRPGIRYSNGAPVRASDFRYSLERLLTVNRTLAPSYYNGIVGASECSARPPERCDLSTGIEVDDAAGTITIHLVRADPDFLHKLAAAPLASVIPAGTPLRRARDQPIPGTGPYRVASTDAEPGSVRLVRNPYFRVWSADARPDGYPDEIRFQAHDTFQASLAAVEKGDADVIYLFGSPAELNDLLTRHAGRLHGEAAPPQTIWIFLNTRVPPFDDVRVRRALNFAVDRSKMVEFRGGAAFAAPTCQILPPIFPGYRPYCPYTLGPNPAGTWTAPDLARAKALVAESGTRGMRVEYVVHNEGGNPLPTARYFVRLLRDLGYRSSRRVIPDFEDYLRYVADPRHRAQIGPAGWGAEKLTPSDFFQRLFSCASFLRRSSGDYNFSEFCSPGIDLEMGRAMAAQTTDPARANELWAEVDHELVDRAVVVPTVSPRYTVFVSDRVGNYQSHPLWGPLLDQLWVR